MLCDLTVSSNIFLGIVLVFRERKVVRFSFAICGTFLLAWLPYSVVSLISVSGFTHKLHNSTLTLAAVCAKTSCLYNALIYGRMSSSFRRAMKQVSDTERSNKLLIQDNVCRRYELLFRAPLYVGGDTCFYFSRSRTQYYPLITSHSLYFSGR